MRKWISRMFKEPSFAFRAETFSKCEWFLHTQQFSKAKLIRIVEQFEHRLITCELPAQYVSRQRGRYDNKTFKIRDLSSWKQTVIDASSLIWWRKELLKTKSHSSRSLRANISSTKIYEYWSEMSHGITMNVRISTSHQGKQRNK